MDAFKKGQSLGPPEGVSLRYSDIISAILVF